MVHYWVQPKVAASEAVAKVPESLSIAIAQRDDELRRIQTLSLTALNVEDSRKRIELVLGDLATLDSTDWIELELVVTRAFLHRIDTFVDGDRLVTRQKLRDDWMQIRELRGDTKPIYELDALEWLLRFERPVLPNHLVRRQLALSITVRSPASALASIIAPPINAATKLFSWMFG